MGSPAVGSAIAHLAFWALLVWGVIAGELSKLTGVILAVLWFLAPFTLSRVPYGPGLFPSLVAIADIVLLLAIFKRDIRIG